MVLEGEPAEAQLFGAWVAASLARNPQRVIEHMVRVFPEAKIRQVAEALDRTPGTGPEPWPEPDQPGAEWFCGWCGRTAPANGGLSTTYPPRRASVFDVDPGTLELKPAPPPDPPEVEDSHPHCVDEQTCQRERDQRLQAWRRHQFPDYKVTLSDLRRLAQEKHEARALLLCAQAAFDAIEAWAELQGQIAAAQDDTVALSAGEDVVALTGGQEPFPWAISGQDQLWLHSMRMPWNRAWTHGHMMAQYGHPVPAASALPAITEAAKTATRRRKVRRRIRLR
jgi:hypothetical protein